MHRTQVAGRGIVRTSVQPASGLPPYVSMVGGMTSCRGRDLLPTAAPRAGRAALWASGVALVLVLLLTLGSVNARAAVPCPGQLSTLSAAFQPGCWRPFAPTSPVNTLLPATPPLAPDDAAVVAHMAAYGWTFEGGPAGFQVDGGGSRPIYFGSPADPVVTVHCTYAFGPHSCTGANGISVDGSQIHVPAGAKPASNADAHMTVIETDTGQEYDFWHTSISGSTLTAGTAATVNTNTGNGTGAAGDAADLALTAGLLRPSELASGQINHALVIDIPCTNATGAAVGYVYPASGGWGSQCGRLWSESPVGAPSLGQLFKLNMTDAQIAASGAPAWEQTIMTALAHYGAYAEDTNGAWEHQVIHIFTQDPTSWTSLGQPDQWATTIAALGGRNGTLTSSIPIPTNRLELVSPCVPEGLCPSAPPPPPAPVARTARRRRSKHHHHHARRHHRRHHHRHHHHHRTIRIRVVRRAA